jgi:hypothetical protein
MVHQIPPLKLLRRRRLQLMQMSQLRPQRMLLQQQLLLLRNWSLQRLPQLRRLRLQRLAGRLPQLLLRRLPMRH